MKNAASIFAAVTIALLTASGHSVFAQDESASYQTAAFVFDGTVVRTHAASSTEIPASPNTIVVRAESVLKKPASVLLRAGEEVTVAVNNPNSYVDGRRARFFADGMLFGKSIEVKEITHIQLPAEGTVGPSTTPSGEQLSKQVERNNLRQEVKAAATILVGRVVAVGPAPLQFIAGGTHLSEHDPEWQSATVQVQSVVKGSPGKEVVVNFPASRDVAWVNYPKLKKGQEATLVLQRDEVAGLPNHLLMAGTQLNAYTAPRPADVRPVSDAKQLSELTQ